MTKKTRNILFYSSIAAFLILSTIIVLFSLGYGYDFSKQQFVKTGGFGVTVNTSATVYINGKLAGSTSFLSNSFAKSRLLPGNYSVSVEKPDYYPWRKSVEIMEGGFADFPNIILIPTKLGTAPLPIKNLPLNISKFYIYKNILYFLAGGQISSSDLMTDKTRVIIKKVETFSPNNNLLTYRGTDKNFYSYSLDNQKVQPLTLPTTSLKNIQKFAVINNIPYLLAKIGTQSNFYELRDGQPSLLAENIVDFAAAPDSSKLAYWNNKQLYIHYLRETSQQPIKIAKTVDLILPTRQITDVQWYKDGQYLILNNSGTLNFIAIDNRNGNTVSNLTIPETSTAFYYDKSSDTLYNLGINTLSQSVLP